MSDPKLITARRKYGAAAIVVYLQLLVMAYRDKGYYLAYGDSDRDGVIWSIKSEVLSGRYEPDAEKIAEMIDCLAAHGLFDGDPRKNPDAKLIDTVDVIDEHIISLGGGSGSSLGTGGMATKLRAAQISTAAGCEMVIANGQSPDILYDVAAGRRVGTRFTVKRD